MKGKMMMAGMPPKGMNGMMPAAKKAKKAKKAKRGKKKVGTY